MEFTIIKDALKKVESDIRNTAANANAQTTSQSWTGGTWGKIAMGHKAIMHIKQLGNDKAGFRQWYDKFVNAFAQVNREYRMALQVIVKGIEMEDRMPTGGIGELSVWIHNREKMSVDTGQLNEGLFAVLTDKTIGEAYLRAKSAESGEGI